MDHGEFSDTELMKLPKWAREKVGWLTHRAKRAEARAEEARLACKPGSRVLADPYDDIPLGLGNEGIRFLMTPDADPRGCWDHVDVRLDSYDRLNISGARPIDIRPSASNHIFITLEERR